MNRIGTVLTFKEGTTVEQAAEALKTIGALLATPETSWKVATEEDKDIVDRQRTVGGFLVKVPFTYDKLIQEYDDKYGGPVWYIP